MCFPILVNTAHAQSAPMSHMVKLSHLLLLNFTFLMLYILNRGFSDLVAFIFYCGKVYFIHLSCMQNVCPATAQTSIKNLPWNRAEHKNCEPAQMFLQVLARKLSGCGFKALVDKLPLLLPFTYMQAL